MTVLHGKALERVGRPLKNRRHEKFCQLWVFGHPDHDPRKDPKEEGWTPDTEHNATQSYIHAGFASRGIAANANGSRLMGRSDVQHRIAELEEEAGRRAQREAFRWVRHLPAVHGRIKRALSGQEELPASAVRIMELVVNRAEGPLQFRFTNPKTGESQEGLAVFVFGGEDGSEPPPLEEDHGQSEPEG